MNKISCDVCMDLMPLVKDGVASEDSTFLVEDHITSCISCQEMYHSIPTMNIRMDDSNDQNIMKKMKKYMFATMLIIMIAGTLYGTALTNGMNMIYNIIIMPIVGALAYLVLGKRVYYGVIGLFIVSASWTVIQLLLDGSLQHSSLVEIILMSCLWPLIYMIFYSIGIAIAALLKFAFQKEKKDEI